MQNTEISIYLMLRENLLLSINIFNGLILGKVYSYLRQNLRMEIA